MLNRELSGALALAILFAATPALAVTLPDAEGDYLPTYVGPTNGDLDVLSISVDIVGSDFVLSATMDGAIGTTADGLYVWGADRGAGTAGFGESLGLDGVLFDSVIILRPDGTGTVNLLPGATDLAPGAVTIDGNIITGVIPLALLPSNGLLPAQYGFNLWPRIAGGTVANIADFAPDNDVLRLAAVPEPASWATMIAGFGLVGGALRRRARRPAAA